MKHLGRYAAATALVFVLTTASVAGQISTGVTSPPTAPREQTGAVTASGQISTGAPASDSVIDLALSLVQSVRALF